MPLLLNEEMIAAGMVPSGPRLRANSSTTVPLVLTNAWQRVNFNGTSPGGFNVNTFPISPPLVEKDVYWDAVNKVFRFSRLDKNYNLTIDFTFSGGLRPCDISYRLYVPSIPAVIFPNPEGTQSAFLTSIERINTPHSIERSRTLYITAATLQYGVGLELQCATLLGLYPSLVACNITIAG